MENKFKPYTLGIFANYAEQNVPTSLHHHDGYELYYLLSGNRNYVTNEKLYAISPNSVTLTKPHTLHSSNGKQYSRIVINFSRDFLLNFYTEKHVDTLLSCFACQMIPPYIINKYDRIKTLFYLVLDKYQNKKYAAFAQYLGELLLTLCDIVNDNPDLKSNDNIPQNIKNILDYIYSFSTQIEKIDDIANKFFISKYYLMHLFKKHVGISVMDYITNAKLMRACRYLVSTNKSINEISELCGFSSCSYFCKVFKKNLHQTPFAYRHSKTNLPHN